MAVPGKVHFSRAACLVRRVCRSLQGRMPQHHRRAPLAGFGHFCEKPHVQTHLRPRQWNRRGSNHFVRRPERAASHAEWLPGDRTCPPSCGSPDGQKAGLFDRHPTSANDGRTQAARDSYALPGAGSLALTAGEASSIIVMALEFARNRPVGEDDSYRGTGERGAPTRSCLRFACPLKTTTAQLLSQKVYGGGTAAVTQFVSVSPPADQLEVCRSTLVRNRIDPLCLGLQIAIPEIS